MLECVEDFYNGTKWKVKPLFVGLLSLLLMAFQIEITPTPLMQLVPAPQIVAPSTGIMGLLTDPTIVAIVFCAMPLVTLIVTGSMGLFVLSYTRRIKSAADSKDIEVKQKDTDAALKAEREQLAIDRERLAIQSQQLTQDFAAKTLESGNDARDAKASASIAVLALKENKVEMADLRKLYESVVAENAEFKNENAGFKGEISALKDQVVGLQKEIESLKAQQVTTREDNAKKDARNKEESDRKDNIIDEQRNEIKELHEKVRVLSVAAPPDIQSQTPLTEKPAVKVEIVQPAGSSVSVTETDKT